MLSHVSTPLPEHFVAFGVQLPLHIPLTQAWFEQGTGVPQLAVRSQVCTPLPEHCVAPGVHVPVHTPAAHV